MKQMTTQDIVRKSDVVKDNNLDWKRVYAGMHYSIEQNTHRVMRVENTLFWLKLLPNDAVNVVAFSSAPSKILSKQVDELEKALKAAGLRIKETPQ